MSLPNVDASGSVYVLTEGIPVRWVGGIGFDSLGRLCTTDTISATDTFNGGWRTSILGQVVVANQSGPNPASSQGGLPFNPNGTMARQVDVVPLSPNEPYVSGGIRVGPLGGTYMTTAVMP